MTDNRLIEEAATDDEREALLGVLDNRLGFCFCQSYAGERHDRNPPCPRVKLADELLQLRRSVVPVPQGDPSSRDRRALAEFIDKSLAGDCGYGVGEFLAGGILSFMSERHGLRAAFAGQGEPSDAQILAALNAHEPWSSENELSDWGEGAIEPMRAALRAAGGVR